MHTIEKIWGGMIILIALAVIIRSRGGFNTVINSIGGQVTSITKQLQARDLQGAG